LAWGLWQHTTNLTTHLHTTDHQRLNRAGITPMPTELALALFDAALADGRATAVPALLDPAVLRGLAKSGTLPPILRGLVRGGTARRIAHNGSQDKSAATEWTRRLTARTASEQLDTMVQLVRAHAAVVLGHSGSSALTDQLAFKQAGFDSLTAVELRNRLGAAVGLRLPATVVFDHPTPLALAAFLRSELAPTQESVQRTLLTELERIEATVLADLAEGRGRTQIAARLKEFLFKINEVEDISDDTGEDVNGLISDATDEEIFTFIDNEL
ncbi:phosphopantetheine-binding protein, partial [Streptomyces sp. NPDC048516]|uniref:phosphopantetheine-binding protein n=1 Tax=Streptomyces sp. NPDC048516 TaxID=3365565 RepID=UPI003710C40E